VTMLRKKINYYSQHWFIRNVATLQAGSFAGTAFQAVVGIFLARLLQPELFGVYALAFGLASIGGLLLGAGTQEAVSTLLGSAYARQDKEEVENVLAFLLKMTFYAGVFTFVLVLFLPWIAEKFYGVSIIGWYAGLVIAGVFLTTSFTAVVQLSLQVISRIKILTLIIFGDQFLRFGFALLLVFWGLGVWGAVGGQFVGSIVLFLISLFIWKKIQNVYPILPSLKALFDKAVRISIKKYFRFSFWVAVDRNMGNLYLALPVVLTGIYVSAGEVAFFKLGFGYVNLALSLLGPVSTLLNIEFSKMKVEDPQKLAKNFMKVSLYGLGLSTLLTAIAVIVSPLAFRILYGESFLPSVNYVFGLLAYGALYGIGVGLGPMWRAVDKVKISILINTIILGAGIPFGLWLINSYGLWGSVVMVTLWFTVSHFISFVYLARKLGNPQPALKK
jgi:O-antigen/teichoic acid export membrane protein